MDFKITLLETGYQILRGFKQWGVEYTEDKIKEVLQNNTIALKIYLEVYKSILKNPEFTKLLLEYKEAKDNLNEKDT